MQKHTPTIALLSIGIGIGIGYLIAPSTSLKTAKTHWSTAATEPHTNAPANRAANPTLDTTAAESDTPQPNSIRGLLQTAFAEDQEYARTSTMLRALQQLDSSSLPEFTDFFQNKPLIKRDFHLWLLFLSAWGESDGMGAIQFVHKKFKDPSVRTQLYLPIVKSWKNYAPREAVMVTATLTSEDSQIDTGLAMSYLEALLENTPDQALVYALKMNDDEFTLDLAGKYMENLAQRDLTAAYETLEAMPYGESRSFATAQYVRVWSQTAPDAAASWMVNEFQEKIDFETLRTVSVNYLKQSPADAMNWAYTLPDRLFSEELLVAMVDEWTRTDRNGVKNWLSLYEPGEELDPVVTAYSTRIAKEDPALALDEWIPQIHNQLKGQSTYYEVAMEWRKEDPDAFQQWLESNNALEPEFKANLKEREFPFANDTVAANSFATVPAATPSNGRDDD